MSTPRSTTESRPFEVRADVPRKLLSVTFRGIVGARDMRVPLDRLRAVLAELGSGFLLVTDLTELERMDLDCVPQVTRLMDLCLAGGLGQVVRIIPHPDKDIGFGLLSLTHYRGKVPIATFESRNDAGRNVPALTGLNG